MGTLAVRGRLSISHRNPPEPVDLDDAIVPPPSPGEPGPVGAPRPRRARVVRIWIAVGVVVSMLVAGTVAAAFVQVPYYLISPGAARATEPLISVEGATTYPSDGSIDFTTVSLRRASALEALMGWLDPTVDVVDEEQILGGQTEQENREATQQEMSDSKQVASAVALEALGYDVIRGTGAVVRGIVEGSPAAGALQVGDVIVAAGDQPITLSSDLARVTRSMKPGEPLGLLVERGGEGEAQALTVVLAPRPEEPDKGFLGVSTTTRDLSFQFPFSVQIDSGSVGGPSAGLAFTLGIIDVLTPGSLTAGKRVAVTGTIDPNGFVGPVGGVEQKTVAVRRSGAELFLVPTSEVDLARKYAGDVRVEGVDTLDQALRVLASVGGDVQGLAQGSSPAGR
ncbi:YlbL family protein [Rhabdothermincola sp.]|uniref:YlbL family protein n=1 Tax=Rhabdothermincola sp. TaxID=2820405 RepID=UPI002FE26EB6